MKTIIVVAACVLLTTAAYAADEKSKITLAKVEVKTVVSAAAGKPAPRATEICRYEYDAGADDADADLAGAGDGEHENLSVRAAGRAELIARNDRSRKAGERRRVGREVAQQRGQEAARGAPERQAEEKTIALLRKARSQKQDSHRAHHSADHAKPTLAQ